ncbi:MAG: NAD-dependent epimerase/dehydratase family protein [Actinobacteria bacterium]|nr:NAD-dependent epimerase/dehydratase family protein [Actinomycetota bacterium]
MRVIVTGGAGFIGANLCRHLVRAAGIDEVVAYDNLSTGARANLDGAGAELVEADLLDLDAMRAAAGGAGAIVHLAARPSVQKSIEDPVASHHANATGTLHVLEAARGAGVGHVLVASSSSVYGSNPTLPKVETLKPSPQSPYAVSKLATETYALAYGASFGLDVLAMRFFNVFGPLQAAGHAYAAVIPAFLDAALKDQLLRIDGDGEQSRDFTFVDSVCAVITDAVQRRVADPEPVNLAFGSRVTLLELIELLEQMLGVELKRQHGPVRAGDVRHSQADQSKLRGLFPAVQPVALEDGLRKTIEWFKTGCGPLAPIR